MKTLRRAEDRGGANHGWLDTKHTFSFADYYDPKHMGFRALRVINEDKVKPGKGFGTHGHRDMEIISWVLEGGLEHRDTIGEGGVLRPGDAQGMSAGTGVMHSEFNASKTEPVHFLQIWLEPDHAGVKPAYDQKNFDLTKGLTLIASPDGAEGSLKINADARLWAARLEQGQTVKRDFAKGRFQRTRVPGIAAALAAIPRGRDFPARSRFNVWGSLRLEPRSQLGRLSKGLWVSITISWRVSYAKHPIAERRTHFSKVSSANRFFRQYRSQPAHLDRAFFGIGPLGVAHCNIERRARGLVLNFDALLFEHGFPRRRRVAPIHRQIGFRRGAQAGRVYGEARRDCDPVDRGLTSVSAAPSSWPFSEYSASFWTGRPVARSTRQVVISSDRASNSSLHCRNATRIGNSPRPFGVSTYSR
jgi:hypothetical protein